jgi:DNA-binding protein H-NS
MPTYQEILDQIQALQKQAEEIRKQELASAIAEIKRIMAKYGITPADLGFGKKETKGKATTGQAKYRDPVTGKTWTGNGRRPKWVLALEAEGKRLESFRI